MASLPNYVAAAKPVPLEARQAWLKNTAPTYAGIMLWFVFWQDIVSGSPTPGGSLAAGLGVALVGLVIAALFCHFLTYLAPALMGMKTGLPLYVVGTSTYGVRGGFFMPGFFMGCLQFGWLAVNSFFSAIMICAFFKITDDNGAVVVPGVAHGIITTIFLLAAVFVGLKGIQYVAKVATYIPIIFLGILVILFVKTVGGLGDFTPDKVIEASRTAADGAAAAPLGATGVLLFLSLYVVGFFATAGAAGVDFGMNNRNGGDVQWGGLVGIALATVVAGGLSILIVAGAYGSGMIATYDAEVVPAALEAGKTLPTLTGDFNSVHLMPAIAGPDTANWMMLLLAIASFAPACFPAFIAANSFKTTMPNVSPWISVGAGTVIALFLTVSGWAGEAVSVFLIVGASFGPICGAMLADYLLAGCKWPGPRAGFNLAGWISWAVGFAVGGLDLVIEKLIDPTHTNNLYYVPCPPMAALIVGFVLYVVLAKAGLEGETLEMPETAGKPAA